MKHMALRTSLLYGLFAAVWILFSDRALVALVPDPVAIGRLSTYKGWAFVAVTGLLLYGTLKTQLQRWQEEMSARVEAEQGFRESEKRYRELVEHANSIILRMDVSGRVTYINEYAQSFFGYGEQEIVGRSVVGTIVPEAESTGRDLKEMIEDIGRSPDAYATSVNENMRRNGERVWVAWANKLIDDTEHAPEILCIGNDITEARRSEGALRRSEAKFRAVVENSNDGILFIDANGVITYRSPSYDRINGYTDEERVGHNSLEVVHPDDLDKVRQCLAQAVRHPEAPVSCEYRIRHKNGSWLWLEATGLNLLGNPDVQSIVVAARNITDRKRSDEDLLTSRLHLSDAADLARIAYWEHDEASQEFIFNDAFYALYATTAEAEGGYRMGRQEYARRFVHPDDLEELGRIIEENRAHPYNDRIEHYEHRVIRRDGQVIHILARNRVIMDREGRVVKTVGMNQDITERKKTEEQLMVASFAMQSSISAVALVDESGTLTFVNDSWLRLWGYERAEEVLGRPVSQFSAAGEEAVALQSLLSGLGYVGEGIGVRKDGAAFDVQFAINPVRAPDGRIVCTMGFFIDISDRKSAEERLKESEERYRFLFDSISDAVFVHPINEDGLPGPFTEVNEAACALLGYSREELLRMTPAGFSTPEGGAFIVPMMRRLQEEKRTVREGMHVAKDGRRIPVEVSLHAFDFRGRPTVLATVRDITQRKAAEQALRESEAKFRSYVESSPLAVFVADREGRIVDVNPAAVTLMGYDAGALSGMRVWEMHPLEDREEGLRKFADFNRDGHVEAEFRFRRKDHSLVWVSLYATMIGDGFSLAYCADITSRKEAEEALRRYELLSGHSRDIILFVSRDGRILEANAAAEAAYGFTREELLGLTIGDLRPPEISGLTDAQRAEADAGGILFESVHRRKDGSTFPVEVSSRGASINGTRALISIVRDITDRKVAEEEIRLLKHSIDVHDDGAYWMDSDARFVYVNEAAAKALGYTPEELLGKTLYDVNPLATPEAMKEVWEGLRKGGSFVGDSIHRRKDGTEFPVEIATTYVQFEGREYACGFARDITEKRKLEEQLRQAQKMEAIGTLAGGVAHDFNNILTVIMGLGNVIQMTVGPDDRVRPHIDQIVSSSQKAADLVQSLLAFSRKQRITLAPHEVNAVVESTAKLLKRLLTEDITLKVDLSAAQASAMLDVSQIDQVLMNLATNARDAMPQGGTLTIRTTTAVLDETFRKSHGFGRPGRYACLSVSDTGIGMDEKTMARIFDPFFTTKEVGKGTGLGLASVYGIVKQHNGYIAVRSSLLEGTTFDVYLPLVETAVREPASASASPRGGSETILVIEDDADVRRMITTILSDRGYVTLGAGDGDTALKVFREHKNTVSLVIMDVVMPGKNGREVFDEITRIDPEARAIFMSGYTGDIVIDKGVEKESVDFLQKPLSVTGLLEKVREVLDR